ncbi:MAG: amidohydrolase [Pirellulaceae bacterium]
MNQQMTDAEKVARLDELISHIWMVRTFLKHCEEAEEDEELREVYRDLYDYMLALGGPTVQGDHTAYLKMAKKKLKRLRGALQLFEEIQPEISSHTNFQMAMTSLKTAVAEVETIVSE